MSATKRWPPNREDCLNREAHIEGPSGYGDWFEWAEKKGKTHDQTQCPGCGLYLIWKPKRRKVAAAGGSDGDTA